MGDDEERWKKLTQVVVESRGSLPTLTMMSQVKAEKLMSEGKIEEVNIRDWVADENGVARDTVVGKKLVWKK